MAKIEDKLVLGLLVVLLVGLTGVLISVLGFGDVKVEGDDNISLVNEVSVEEAKTIALDAVEGVVNRIDRQGDLYFVKIAKGGKEVEVIVNMRTGEILSIGKEEAVLIPLQKVNGIITEGTVRKIVFAEVGGSISRIEENKESGRLVYEVGVYVDGKRGVVDVDGVTGEVLDVELG